MRVQVAVDTISAGICTCEKCKKYTQCVVLSLIAGDEESVERQLCGTCLVKGSGLKLEFDVSPSYTKAQRKRSNRKAKRSEVKTADETGGRCTGYFPDAGDSRNERFLFEDKTPTSGDRKSFRLTEEIVLKGRSQAQKAGLTPVFRIHLRNTSVGAMLWGDLINLMEEG